MNKREEFEKALDEWYSAALEYAERGKLISKERRTEAYSEVLRLYDALAQEHDKLVERSVGAMAIAEGAEGYEKVSVDCPMLGAVSELRSKYDAALAFSSNTPRPIFIENAPSVAGWKLVPIEPTAEMINGLVGPNGFCSIRLIEAYRAMLAAAPLPGENPRGGPLKFGR